MFIPLEPLPKLCVVSIIIPSYNQGSFIKETIDSVLSQNYRPLEIIVIDGASTDETVSILKMYENIPEVKWISEPDQGVVDAVNKGFALATGDIISIQSSDDFYLPHAVQTMVKAFESHPDVGLAFADIITIDANGKELRRTNFPPYTLEGFLSKEFYIPQPSAFFRQELLQVVGGWDQDYFIADTEFWLRMVFRTQVLKVNDCIAKRRVHDAQRDHQVDRIADSYWMMIKKSPDLASASLRLRRIAYAGAYINNIRYSSHKLSIFNTLNIWRALFLYPKMWMYWLKSPLLIPFYLEVISSLAFAKRKIYEFTRPETIH